jgi:hypothetical protein
VIAPGDWARPWTYQNTSVAPRWLYIDEEEERDWARRGTHQNTSAAPRRLYIDDKVSE